MTASQIIMSIVGSAVLLVGYLLAQRGKRGDQVIQQNKDQFERLMNEARYWHENADGARDELESFRDRQLRRCRDVTSAASATISRLMQAATGGLRSDAEQTLDDIQHHQETDHSQ